MFLIVGDVMRASAKAKPDGEPRMRELKKSPEVNHRGAIPTDCRRSFYFRHPAKKGGEGPFPGLLPRFSAKVNRLTLRFHEVRKRHRRAKSLLRLRL